MEMIDLANARMVESDPTTKKDEYAKDRYVQKTGNLILGCGAYK